MPLLHTAARHAALALIATLFGAAPGGASASSASAELSAPAHTLLQWIARDADNQGRPFIVIDKRQARLWVFDGQRRLLADAPVLLDSATGDTSAPDIGTRPLSRIQDHERTTPAGRFPLEPGENLKGTDIFWIDYDAAVSLHRVRSAHAGERRLERLASPTADDNRISYGCVNVPAAFYDRELRPRFSRGQGFAYVLPERLSLAEAFPTLTRGAGEAGPAPQR